METVSGIMISGFADEISSDLAEQLSVVQNLGMRYISLRSAEGKMITDYSLAEVEARIWPRLQAAGIGVSSLGSPIGKIAIADGEGFRRQKEQLHTLCQIANLLACRYIRIFSFYLPAGEAAEQYSELVLEQLRQFCAIAASYGIILIHENEKDIFGSTGQRCLELCQKLASPYFKAAFDFANFVQCGEDCWQCWDLLQSEVAYIHIKDACFSKLENVLCGTGDGQLAALLQRAIVQEGYRGFLTLEPHLVLFDSLQALELVEAKEIIRENQYASGAEAYAAQYQALRRILQQIQSAI